MPVAAFARGGFARRGLGLAGTIPAADFEFCTVRTEYRFASKELLRPPAQPWFPLKVPLKVPLAGPAPALFFQPCFQAFLYPFFIHRLSLVAFQCSPIREFPSPFRAFLFSSHFSVPPLFLPSSRFKTISPVDFPL